MRRVRLSESLIAACLRGDALAQTALFEQHKALVYRTAYLMLGEARDAEDTLQEVFINVFRFLDSYDPARAAFTTWLYRITVNACLSRMRGSNRPALLELDEDTPGDPGDLFSRLSLIEQVGHLLDVLDADQRAVIVLRFYGDLAYQEIADTLDVPLGTVQSRFGRALRKMRTAMQLMNEEESV
jgi:RNA polymerase sigma-70 factor (ECF subfamily)